MLTTSGVGLFPIEFEWHFRVCLRLMWCKLFIAMALFSVAIQVTSTGPQKIQKPQGDSVTLACTYSESPSDTGQLDVEWSSVSQDMTQKDKLVRNNEPLLEHDFVECTDALPQVWVVKSGRLISQSHTYTYLTHNPALTLCLFDLSRCCFSNMY